MTTTRTTTTARPVTFAFTHKGNRSNPKTFPAGTEVYAWVRPNGKTRVRIVGTLYTQDVTPAALVA